MRLTAALSVLVFLIALTEPGTTDDSSKASPFTEEVPLVPRPAPTVKDSILDGMSAVMDAPFHFISHDTTSNHLDPRVIKALEAEPVYAEIVRLNELGYELTNAFLHVAKGTDMGLGDTASLVCLTAILGDTGTVDGTFASIGSMSSPELATAFATSMIVYRSDPHDDLFEKVSRGVDENGVELFEWHRFFILGNDIFGGPKKK